MAATKIKEEMVKLIDLSKVHGMPRLSGCLQELEFTAGRPDNKLGKPPKPSRPSTQHLDAHPLPGA